MQTLKVPGHQVVQFLGSGARSTIWQVRNRQTGQMLAVKRVQRRSAEDARFVEQAINEYEVACALDHPAIRRIHRLRRVSWLFMLREVQIFMELCEGKSVQEARPTAVEQTVAIFAQVADALAHMNARGFVHADMKPNNILVGPDGTVKVIDLGQSCPIGTMKQRIQGTPDFIAPEQVQRQPLDGRTDVFNFGAALYWTLTGQPIPTLLPKSNGSILKADMTVVPPEQINGQVSAALSKLVLDCVEPVPARRPPSMSAVGARLNLIHKAIARSAPPPPPAAEPEPEDVPDITRQLEAELELQELQHPSQDSQTPPPETP